MNWLEVERGHHGGRCPICFCICDLRDKGSHEAYHAAHGELPAQTSVRIFCDFCGKATMPAGMVGGKPLCLDCYDECTKAMP